MHEDGHVVNDLGTVIQVLDGGLPGGTKLDRILEGGGLVPEGRRKLHPASHLHHTSLHLVVSEIGRDHQHVLNTAVSVHHEPQGDLAGHVLAGAPGPPVALTDLLHVGGHGLLDVRAVVDAHLVLHAHLPGAVRAFEAFIIGGHDVGGPGGEPGLSAPGIRGAGSSRHGQGGQQDRQRGNREFHA